MIKHFKNNVGKTFSFVTLGDKEFGYGEDYDIIGLVNELTESQQKIIVEYHVEEHTYRNYVGNTIDDAWECPTSKLSFESLVKRLEINDSLDWLVLVNK